MEHTFQRMHFYQVCHLFNYNLTVLQYLYHSIGLVYSEIRPDSSSFALKCLDELVHERKTYTKALPYPWLLAKMRQIGLETYTHNFTLNYPLGGGKVYKGKNVYGILRAPRIASTESIVISVPYRPPESMHAEITHGVPLMFAFAEFARSRFFLKFFFLIL